MRVDITGRHIDITPAIRDFTEEKLRKLERSIDDIIEAHVVLSVEKHRHIAEIVIHGRHRTFTANEATGDLYASIGNAVDKIDKQARRLKDKWTARRKHARPTFEAIAGGSVESGDLDGDGARSEGPPRIIRMPVNTKKPMSVEDAAMALVDSGREFLVFREARSQRISVMYRRRDGHLGLIDPEA